MLRITLLPIVLLTLSAICMDACMGQTFQYSRGWTNGKRSSILANTLNQQQQQQQPQRYLQKDENIVAPTFFDDHLLERCLIHMRNLVGRTALYSGAFSLKPTPTNSNSNLNNNNNNNNNNNDGSNNNLFGSHHQSNELFDELNGAMETNDYGKH